jgi:hypothetical protein
VAGHGGDGFLKFHNYEEISSEDLVRRPHCHAFIKIMVTWRIVSTHPSSPVQGEYHSQSIINRL